MDLNSLEYIFLTNKDNIITHFYENDNDKYIDVLLPINDNDSYPYATNYFNIDIKNYFPNPWSIYEL